MKQMSKDYPLLTAEEDAADFALSADPLPDDSRIKERKRKEAEEQSKRDTPDLFPSIASTLNKE